MCPQFEHSIGGTYPRNDFCPAAPVLLGEAGFSSYGAFLHLLHDRAPSPGKDMGNRGCISSTAVSQTELRCTRYHSAMPEGPPGPSFPEPLYVYSSRAKLTRTLHPPFLYIQKHVYVESREEKIFEWSLESIWLFTLSAKT